MVRNGALALMILEVMLRSGGDDKSQEFLETRRLKTQCQCAR